MFFITRLAVGGAETQVVRVASELRRRGWRVGVLSLGTPTAFVDELEAAGVEVHTVDMNASRPSPLAVARARRLVRRLRPDLICAFLFHATALAAIVAGLRRRPVVVSSVRDPTLGGRGRLLFTRFLDRAGRIDFTVANADRVRDDFAGRGVIPSRRLGVVRNAIPMDVEIARPPDEVRRELGLAGDAFLWLAVGNFLPQKDYPTLLRAFEALAEDEPSARLAIAGRGEPPAEVAGAVARLGGRVQLLGMRGDVPSLMAACDAFVLSSSSEGFPNVVMEALRASRLVVATDVGGVSELIEPAVSGWVVPPRQPRALGHAMAAAMRMPARERAALAAAGRERLVARHELGRVVDGWETLFRRLINHPSSASVAVRGTRG